MKLNLRQKVLLSMGVVAGIGALAGAGTFATFTAQTSNPNNIFASGTLVLSNKVGSGTACLSTGGGNTDSNSNAGCDTVFNLAVKAPGDSGGANLTLKNMGSLPASVLKVFSGSCTDADAAGENYHGTGSPCGVVQVTIQQYTSSAFTTPSACLYGGSPDSGVTCDFSDATKTLTDFVTNHANFSSGVSAGALAAAGGADSTWVRVAVQFPSTAGNSYQGRSATMTFNWQITQ
jgi:predicted ribosomally synthesized peptide with SipW-like signal peptide